MTDDLLARAARALREESEAAEAGERFTRARVMAGLQQNAGRRRLRLAFALPLAACFAAATAFGTMKGRSAAIWHEVTEALGFSHPEEAPKASAKPPKRLPAAANPIDSAPPSEPAAAIEAPQPVKEAEPQGDAPSRAVPSEPSAPSGALAPRPERSAPPTSTPTPTRVEAAPEKAEPAAPAPELNDPAHELYRVAHQSHFVDHDFAAALRAWDAYLAAAPSGRFAPEARYNRALCLVRLGRKDDAERALRPFADGAYGSYRRDEAKALIEALQR